MDKLRTEELDVFSELLFRTLDRLGADQRGKDLLPFFLSERPSAFEKYPRMLIALVQRHGVEAGFYEWSTKVLRDANRHRKETEYAKMEELRLWMCSHQDLFDAAHLAHLKRSLYGRIYTYLYPRRLLTVSYARQHRGDADALNELSIRSGFRPDVSKEIETLSETYGSGKRLEQIIADAEDFLVINRGRYAWGKKNGA